MAKLDEDARDELLIRLDERMRGVKEEDLPEIKTHLTSLNRKVQKNETRSKVNRALISIAFSILGIGSGAGVTKLLNLW